MGIPGGIPIYSYLFSFRKIIVATKIIEVIIALSFLILMPLDIRRIL